MKKVQLMIAVVGVTLCLILLAYAGYQKEQLIEFHGVSLNDAGTKTRIGIWLCAIVGILTSLGVFLSRPKDKEQPRA